MAITRKIWSVILDALVRESLLPAVQEAMGNCPVCVFTQDIDLGGEKSLSVSITNYTDPLLKRSSWPNGWPEPPFGDQPAADGAAGQPVADKPPSRLALACAAVVKAEPGPITVAAVEKELRERNIRTDSARVERALDRLVRKGVIRQSKAGYERIGTEQAPSARGRPAEVGRALYGWLLANPDSRHGDVLTAMGKCGFSPSAVKDNLRGLKRVGLVVQTGDAYRAVPLD